MTLGKRLQQLRQSMSLSQEAFGEKLNVSRQTISKWELDQSLPELAKIVQISRIFSVTTDSLLIDGITSFDMTTKNFVCGIYRSVNREIAETEQFSLVLENENSLLIAKLYVGHQSLKRLCAIVVRDKALNSTQYAYQTQHGEIVTGNDNLALQLGEHYNLTVTRDMMRTAQFTVDSTQAKTPTVSEVGLRQALIAWRGGAVFTADKEEFRFSLCTPHREYIMHINLQGSNIYCGASFNTVFDMGLFTAGQYFRIRHYKDNSEPFCAFFADFNFTPETLEPKINAFDFADEQKKLAWIVKRYSDDEIILNGCDEDEYSYRRDQKFAERYVF